MTSNKTFLSVASPFANENLWHIISKIRETEKFKNIDFDSLKAHTIDILKKLIDYDMITINFAFKNEIVEKEMYSDLIKKIEKTWNEETEYIDLYTMVWFKYKDWYVNGLREKGLSEKSNWNIFINEDVIDLEKWIIDNKPKE